MIDPAKRGGKRWTPRRRAEATEASRRLIGEPPPGIYLWWLPLGAGGHFVRFNGRVYESLLAWRDGRARQDLYHSALVVALPHARYVIEDAWPIPDEEGASRGVAVEGPVFSRRFERTRALRYEVRCWRDGVIPDAVWAVESPQRLDADARTAHRLLELVADVPAHVWGRDEARTGDMWNSNSVIAWLLTRAGLPIDDIHAPRGGRAPGWRAGVALARRESVASASRSNVLRGVSAPP